MTGLRGCCCSSTQGSRAIYAVENPSVAANGVRNLQSANVARKKMTVTSQPYAHPPPHYNVGRFILHLLLVAMI